MADNNQRNAGQSDVPLRIAHITNYQVPGYGYEEIQLARQQHRMGHDVTILTSNFLHPDGQYAVLRRRFPSRHVDPSEELVDGVRIRRLASVEVARRLWIRGLESSLRKLDPDVVHIHNLLQFHVPRVALMRAVRRYRGAVVVDDHMHRGFMRRSTLGRLFYFTYRNLGHPLVARYVDRFSAIAPDTRDYLRKECGVRADIEIVPLGVDTKAFVPDAESRRLVREQLHLAPAALVLIYTGKVIAEKGVHLLVEAAGLLGGEGIDIAVVVVGDADEAYERRLRTLLRAATRVALHLEPSMDNDRLPRWYAAADVGVWPRQESMAVFEAMATGLPVVVSSVSGLAQLVTPDRGLTYAPETAESLADCLRKLATPEIRVRLGLGGRQYAANHLSWTLSAERYVALYREALASRAAI